MSVTPQSDYYELGTEIDLAMWTLELDKKGALTSPLFDGIHDPEGLAGEMYQYVVDNGRSAEFWLAIAGKEHTWGTNANSVLHRGNTRSWTNARTIRHPKITGTLYHDPARGSSYVRYRNVFDSLKDGLYRIEEPGYSYAGKRRLAEIFSVWAPKEDQNDPEGYSWWVANYINGIRARMENPLVGGDMATVPWYPADRRHYTPGRAVVWPDVVIVHHTDGFDSLWWLSRSPNSDVSAHYLMNHDGSPRAQLVRHADTAHTTGFMNPRALSCEWERYWTDPARRQEWIPPETYRRFGRHIAEMVRVERLRGNPNFRTFEAGQLRDHNDFYNTVCPGNLDTSVLYREAMAWLEDRPQLHEGMRWIEETGRIIFGGFRGLYERLEQEDDGALWARVMGPPRTNEGWATLDGRRVRVQKFQKGWVIWNQDLPAPYDVTFMNKDDEDRLEGFEEDWTDLLQRAA